MTQRGVALSRSGGAGRNASAGLAVALGEVVAEQRLLRGGLAKGAGAGAVEREAHDFLDRLVVGAAARADALGERAAIGEVGVRVDLEDERLAGRRDRARMSTRA